MENYLTIRATDLLKNAREMRCIPLIEDIYGFLTKKVIQKQLVLVNLLLYYTKCVFFNQFYLLDLVFDTFLNYPSIFNIIEQNIFGKIKNKIWPFYPC